MPYILLYSQGMIKFQLLLVDKNVSHEFTTMLWNFMDNILYTYVATCTTFNNF